MQSTIDIKDFRRALGQFPTGVTVITTVDENDNPVGVTASSFNSVSMEPPLVLWSVAKSAYSAKVFEQAGFFAVNVLGKHQVDISNRCATQGGDKFAGLNYRTGRGNFPVLEGTSACFECQTWNQYDGGDHIIIVGEIIDYHYNDSIMPLVFARGSYAVSAPQAPSKQVLGEQGFLSNYLLYQLHAVYNSYSAELYPLLRSEFGISPEEWRILTLLADTQAMDLQQLAQSVMQPEDECEVCLQRLQAHGYLHIETGDSIRLERHGEMLAENIFAFAKQHEKSVLNSLPAHDQQILKGSLKLVQSTFGNH